MNYKPTKTEIANMSYNEYRYYKFYKNYSLKLTNDNVYIHNSKTKKSLKLVANN